MRVLIAGGGTGGHLTPALAVAEALRDADPGADVLVVGRQGGVAERLVVEAGLPLHTLRISGVDAGNPATMLRALSQLPGATRLARRLLRDHRIDVVVGAGGYVCVPVVAAAQLRRTPVVLLEQNAYPGRATRLLARGAAVVASSFAQTSRYLPGAHVVRTGNPIRAEVRRLVPAPQSDRCRHLLVTGGSQGARRINRALLAALPELLQAHPELRVMHQCGRLDWDEVQQARDRLPAALRSRYEPAAFFDDMGERIAAADLVVMRAGGSSLAECSALGRPMILVPYPHAGGHQAFNARAYAGTGAAAVLRDEECDSRGLANEVSRLVDDPVRWRSMAEASARLGVPDAAMHVARLVRDLIVSRGGRAA